MMKHRTLSRGLRPVVVPSRQEALKNHDSWMEDVSNTLQQMQEKEENLTEDRSLRVEVEDAAVVSYVPRIPDEADGRGRRRKGSG